MRLVISTCRPEEAEKIANTVVEERLTASVNMIPGGKTRVRWKGECITQDETLLIMRTRSELVWKLEKRIVELNSFEIPEIATIEIREYSAPYAEWLRDATRQDGEIIY
ncbi:MAG: divalent-cation tolerance protein CutA [Candidatus Eremiobacteraeota bacterium]|nr:divalent-cation tolerance protein CutA [Candidatus Eremiobacteraeota bacterium]